MSAYDEKLANFLAETIPNNVMTTRDIAVTVYKRAWLDRKYLDMKLCRERSGRLSNDCYNVISSEE